MIMEYQIKSILLSGLTAARDVALDLVGHHLLESLLDAMYEQFISCPYQRSRIFHVLLILQSHVDP